MKSISKKAAIADKNLPSLQKALDAEAMVMAFEELFREQYSERGLKVAQCEVGRVYHKPGRSCDIRYRLLCRDNTDRSHAPWFHATISANGGPGAIPGKEEPETWPGCGFWKPVSRWPEMKMTLNAFPYDPKLPYLGQLLEPEFVRQQVEANLREFDLPKGWKCREVVSHRIKYMPGKRCVLRYELLVTDGVGNEKQILFYGKTYPNAKSRYVYHALRNVCESPACRNGLLNIPKPITHIEGANTVWQHAWQGKGFSEIGQELGWTNLPGGGFLPKIANMLAALHNVAVENAQLAPGPSPPMVLDNAIGDAGDIVQFLPEKRATLEEITKTLQAYARDGHDQGPQTIIHGTFKIAQILCRDSEVALVDFDSVAFGDPLYDVAEFIASMLNLRVIGAVPAAPIHKNTEMFFDCYQRDVHWACNRRRVAWYVVAFLLAKIHTSLKRPSSSRIKNISLAFEMVHEWLDMVRK